MILFRILFCALFLFTFTNIVSAHELYKTEIDGYKITSIKIEKGTGYKVIVGVSQKGESLDSLIKKYNGVSGVNGAYFHPADYGGVNESNAYRVSNGVKYSKWNETGAVNVIFAFDKNQDPFLFQNAHDYSTGRGDIYMTGRTINLDKKSDIHNGIGNFPLLLKNGEDMLSNALEISEKMKLKSLKNFICSTKDGNTIFMGSIQSINIYNVPSILKNIGCYNAINLDAGGSSAMVYDNGYIRGPGRDIMDAFIVVKDNEKLEQNIINNKNQTNILVGKKLTTEQKNEAFKKNILKKYSKNIDKIFSKLEKKMLLNSKQKQLDYYKKLSKKIEILISKKDTGFKNKIIFEYLKNLVDQKIKN